jgi:hypothetical protein
MEANHFKDGRSPAKAVTHNVDRGLLPGNKFPIHINDTFFKHFLSLPFKSTKEKI